MKGIINATYGPLIEESFTKGLLCYQMEFDGNEIDLNNLTNVIHEITNHKGPINKFLYLNGNFTQENQASLLSLCIAMKSRGFNIGAKIKGNIYFQWLKEIIWLNVTPPLTSWLGFDCHEFHYTLSKESLEEPKIYPTNKNSLLYLHFDEDINIQDAIQIAENSEKPWRIISIHDYKEKLI